MPTNKEYQMLINRAFAQNEKLRVSGEVATTGGSSVSIPKTTVGMYTTEDAVFRTNLLKIHQANDAHSNLLGDYTRARMIITSLLSSKDSDDKYIARLEKLTDTLMGQLNNGL